MGIGLYARDVITSVKVVDGVLNVNTVPEFDSEDSVDNLLTKPSSIDYVKVCNGWQVG